MYTLTCKQGTQSSPTANTVGPPNLESLSQGVSEASCSGLYQDVGDVGSAICSGCG